MGETQILDAQVADAPGAQAPSVTSRAKLEAEARRLLTAGVSGNVFPGGVAAVSYPEGGRHVTAIASAGRLEPGGDEVRPSTPFDLASLTKPVVATTALKLIEAGKLTSETRVEQAVTDLRGGPGTTKTLEELMTHRSGLAAWGGLYLDVPHEPGTSAARRWILGEASRRTGGTEGRVVYSDLGYILAGEMVARAGGGTLHRAVAEQVTEPLGIAETLFFAGALPSDKQAQLVREVAPTERCEWRGRLVRGEVHDENCFALGGVSGHAGLFGDAGSVVTYGRAVLDAFLGRSSWLKQESMEFALKERPEGTHRFGWDTKSPDGSATKDGQARASHAQVRSTASAAGKHLGPRTFGHLGFTGTSIWCDPDRDLVVVLLTNRVFPSRSNEKIRGFRPAFHDGLVAALAKSVSSK